MCVAHCDSTWLLRNLQLHWKSTHIWRTWWRGGTHDRAIAGGTIWYHSPYLEVNRTDTFIFYRVSITSFAQIIRFFNVSFDIWGVWCTEIYGRPPYVPPKEGIYPVVSKNGIWTPGHLERLKIRYFPSGNIWAGTKMQSASCTRSCRVLQTSSAGPCRTPVETYLKEFIYHVIYMIKQW